MTAGGAVPLRVALRAVAASGSAREGPRSKGNQRQSLSLPTMLILRLLTTNQSNYNQIRPLYTSDPLSL